MKSSASVASQSSGAQAPAALLERLFLDAPMAFQIYEAVGTCVLSNTAFHRMFAVDTSREYNIFADVTPARRGLREAVQRAFAGETVRLAVESRDTLWPTTTLTGEGLGSGVEATVFPVADRDNVVRHVAICYQHAPLERWRRSEQLRIDEERQKSNERLRRAFEAARMRAWETDLVTRAIHVSENAAELLGLPAGTALERLDDALAVVHPEDRPSLEEALKLVVQQGSAQARRFRIIR
ncbi:MAG: PAS domain-containing protein, partial [Polyangiaceae bacterium]